MNILYVCGQINAPGGVQKVAIEKANYFSNVIGNKIAILTTPSRQETSSFPIDPNVTIFTGPEYSLDEGGNRLGILRRISRMFKFRRYGANVIREFNPDIVVHSGGYEIIFLYGLYNKAKWICEFHFSRKSSIFAPKRNWIEMKARKLIAVIMDFCRTRLDAFIVLTKEDLHAWEASGLKFKKIMQIYNSISFPVIEDRKSEFRKKKIIAVGRLDFQKKTEDLIKIWGGIEKDFPDWSFDIYGEGPDRAQLEEQIKKLKLSRIFLMGNTTQIKEKMLGSEIYAMTSSFEGMPMVLLEAQGCGLPCVSFVCPCGPRDIIEDGTTGYLIEDRSIEKFIEKLKMLMTDQEKREKMGMAGALRVATCFSKEKIMNQWTKLYNSLTK